MGSNRRGSATARARKMQDRAVAATTPPDAPIGRVMGDHLIVLHSAVRACAGYSRHEAPSLLLEGSSMARDTEHGRAITGSCAPARDARGSDRGGDLRARRAGLSKGIRRQARAACEDYFYNRLR